LITIRPIKLKDIDKGFPDILENLVPAELDKESSKKILEGIIDDPRHKIFVAEDNDNSNCVIGTTTLLVEQKFIGKGMRVGYIEDVSVKKGYERQGIGRKLVSFATDYAIQKESCSKILLYCSKSNVAFYERIGYKLLDDTAVMRFDKS
jgi:ribosomal protein S18 acetylase RimI-like enzyme